LTDRGTFIKFEEKIDPVILVEGDEALMNPYGVIAVNPATHPHVKYDAATAWIDFLTSAEGQRLIDDYRIRGKQLFHRWPDQPPTGDGD